MGEPIKKNAQYFTEIQVLLTVPETSIRRRHHLHLLHCVFQGFCDAYGDEADEQEAAEQHADADADADASFGNREMAGTRPQPYLKQGWEGRRDNELRER